MWRNTTTRKNAEKFFSQFGGPKTIIRFESLRGMARYLTYMDNPEKTQYPLQDVLEINSIDWTRLSLTESTKDAAIAVVLVVEDQKPTGYLNLLKLCEVEHKELLDFTTRQTVFCREVIWSYWHGVRSRETGGDA
ncbi:Rep family protein [Bifidobacterium sp. H6bp9]|uniref:Rep family protein n=1 Tax=Bifidobacterium sp. H6bp9 TaxID=3051961 RepID=UPI0037BFA641